jgi:hypothetical protein
LRSVFGDCATGYSDRLLSLEHAERFKIWGVEAFVLVLIRWLLAGQRLEETVPLTSARHRRNQLEAEGATVYWSERLVNC